MCWPCAFSGSGSCCSRQASLTSSSPGTSSRSHIDLSEFRALLRLHREMPDWHPEAVDVCVTPNVAVAEGTMEPAKFPFEDPDVAVRLRRERRALMTAAGMLALGSAAIASDKAKAAGADAARNPLQTVATYKDLRRLDVDETSLGQLFEVAGAWSPGDGAHGLFLCSHVEPNSDNSGMTIRSDKHGFCFRRLVEDTTVHARWFGAIADGKSHPLS